MTADAVLVCDPDPDTQRELSSLLHDAGYHLVAVTTGEDAVDAVARVRPQAAIIDLEAPPGGLELCRMLRSAGSMPLLAVSDEYNEAEMIDLLRSGADDYLTRPLHEGELLARLAARLRAAPSELDIEADGVVIDLSAHLVTVDGELVHLTSTEFALLRVLATSPGLVTYRALAVAIWGTADGDVIPRLRTHIANLRAKLNTDHPRELIRTMAGVGYRFARSLDQPSGSPPLTKSSRARRRR